MAALSDFARYVRTEVPMCPEIQILDAILHAGIEFCKRTKIQQEIVDVVTVAGTSSYDLTLVMASDTDPDRILNVRRDSMTRLEPTTQQETIDDGLDVQNGTPSHYYLSNRSVVLLPIPDSIETLSVTVKAHPSESATTLPDALYQQYRTEIAAGAKFRLMSMAGKEWTNPESALLNGYVFERAISKEQLRHAKGGDSKPIRSVINSF